ncbi:MATE family efflux transporter [Pseudidiomarina gelatinasegens]|jgi:MATE family multidrug resistance protein|uniref:MATE family efflux transporter n=1 Tax=Pseudidiomarina gelatinasegens TaxID=2487740 RepID=A0A451GEA0_9GAMM|nr:MATE family efflux transporter [Pseudidiomarina gelatinasegens]RWU11278.1 MATE family efflux transporter [Pseudidiomarina gelatinasegens]
MKRINKLPFNFGKRADHRTIFAIALPMIISNIAAPLLGLVDTAIIGHLPQSIYLSAVALGAMIVSFIYLLAIFLRMTTTAEIAHAFGAKNHAAAQQVVVHGMVLAVGIGLLLLLVTPWIIDFSWWVINPSPDLQRYASQYIGIRLWAAPAALINLLVLGTLLGRQQSRAAMALVIFTNAVNVIADVVLILGLGMNVAGAAWASVLAEVSTALLGLWLIRDVLPAPHLWRITPSYLKRFAAMNRDVFIRSLLLQLCMATMTGYAARFGTVVVAANAVLMQFLLLISLGLDGIAYAVEALLGAARGRKDTAKIRYWMHLTLFWSMLFALVYSLIFFVLGDWIIRMLTDLPDVISVAQRYLPWLIVLPLLGHWSYYYDGVFIGLGLTHAMRNTMAVSAIGVFVPVWLLSQWWLPNENANHGLWLALSLFLLARGCSQWVYLRQRGLTSLVQDHPSE